MHLQDKWQLIGLPCNHASTIIGTIRQVAWKNYVHPCYFTEKYRLAYSGSISPLPDKSQWKCLQPGISVKAPDSVRSPSRSRKKRMRPADEPNKIRRAQRCKRCNGLGHQARTCKEPTQGSQQASPSGMGSQPTSTPSTTTGRTTRKKKLLRLQPRNPLNHHLDHQVEKQTTI